MENLEHLLEVSYYKIVNFKQLQFNEEHYGTTRKEDLNQYLMKKINRPYSCRCIYDENAFTVVDGSKNILDVRFKFYTTNEEGFFEKVIVMFKIQNGDKIIYPKKKFEEKVVVFCRNDKLKKDYNKWFNLVLELIETSKKDIFPELYKNCYPAYREQLVDRILQSEI